jgi:hypothetical protein
MSNVEPNKRMHATRGGEVIENVPVISSPHCGESYLMPETLHELERLKTHRRSLASKRCTGELGPPPFTLYVRE